MTWKHMLVVMVMSIGGIAGCSSSIGTSGIRAVLCDGSVELTDGRKIPLDYITMRAVRFTDEPCGVCTATLIVRSIDSRVRLRKLPGDAGWIVLYRQELVHPAPAYASGYHVLLPRDEWVSVNELMINMGLAFYRPPDHEIDRDIETKLANVQLEYARAVWRGYPRPPQGPPERSMLRYPSLTFIPRLCAGDLDAYDSPVWRARFDGPLSFPFKDD